MSESLNSTSTAHFPTVAVQLYSFHKQKYNSGAKAEHIYRCLFFKYCMFVLIWTCNATFTLNPQYCYVALRA